MDSDKVSNKYQSSPLKEGAEENSFEESYEQDFENALENYESVQISSTSMNYSESKTGGFDEHVDLPPPRYAPIEENLEENEESKFQQPTKEELDLQNQRIKKAKEALIKIKKDELAKKKGKNQKLITIDKVQKEQKKSISTKTLSVKSENKTISKQADVKGKKNNENAKNLGKREKNNLFEEIPKAEGTFAVFEIELPTKGTNAALNVNQVSENKISPSSELPIISKQENKTPTNPVISLNLPPDNVLKSSIATKNSVQENKTMVPPLKLNKTSSTEIKKTNKKEEEVKLIEEHKGNLENLRSIFDEKKAKNEQKLKNMEEIQKKLLEREKNYKIPAKEPPKLKKNPQPPPAPKPRSLDTNCYKLHQLAESTGNTESRLTANKLSGSMLQTIKILSSKVSEEFTYQEITEEIKRIEQAEKMLSTGKDMKREEVDYHEETKKKLIIYKGFITENMDLMKKKFDLLKQQEELTDKIKKLEPLKAVVKIGNGKYIRAGLMPDGLVDTLEELDSVGSEVMKENPIDVVIEKIEKQGLTLRQLFSEIDADGDKILSITEIRNGLAGIQIKLSEDDKNLLVKTLDLNSDGYVSEEEFFKILDPKLRVQQEYRTLIGNLDVNNPIIFEERILDMKLRGRMLNKEIPQLVKNLQSKVECEKKLFSRIKQLEKILEERQVKSISAKDVPKQLEDQIRNVQAKKLEIFQYSMQEKSTSAANVNLLQEKLIAVSKEQALTNAEYEDKKNALSGIKYRNDALINKEKKLDESNRIIAIVIIQAHAKKYLQRIRYKLEKERVEKALSIVVPAMKKFSEAQKEKRNESDTNSKATPSNKNANILFK